MDYPSSYATMLELLEITEVTESEDIPPKSSRQIFWDKLEQARLQHGDKIFSDSVELLREDRQR